MTPEFHGILFLSDLKPAILSNVTNKAKSFLDQNNPKAEVQLAVNKKATASCKSTVISASTSRKVSRSTSLL